MIRVVVLFAISAKRTGAAAGVVPRRVVVLPLRGAIVGASTNVFQASHPGHWPTQRNDSWPHAEQKKIERAFAIARGFGATVVFGLSRVRVLRVWPYRRTVTGPALAQFKADLSPKKSTVALRLISNKHRFTQRGPR